MNRQFFILIMMTALLAAVFTSCKKDEKDEEGEKDNTPPAWFTDAKTNFKNGRFVPGIEDVFPGSMLGTITSSAAGASSVQSSSAKSSGISAKSFEGCETLTFSEIRNKRGYSSSFDGFLNIQEYILSRKSTILETFEGCELTEQNVWVSDGAYCRVKYTEDANGKYVYWTRDQPERNFVGGKLSMNSDGSNELYCFTSDNDGNLLVSFCSYLKGDKFIIVDSGAEEEDYYSLWLFETTKDGEKKGVILSIGKNDTYKSKHYGIGDFKGDNADYKYYNINTIVNEGTGHVAGEGTFQQAFSIINGVECPYNGYDLDIKAFANIDEIYYKEESPNWYRLQGIKLTDGDIIEIDRYFSFYQQSTCIDGVFYPWKPGDGFSITLNLVFESDELETLSDCIPEPLRPHLQLSNGFEELYAELKEESVGYFDNYKIEFPPIASIKVSMANFEEIYSAITDYIQEQREGF